MTTTPTPGDSTETREVGPEEARQLLGMAAMRYIAAQLEGRRIAHYIVLMAAGGWKPNIRPIPITADGYLLEGINRLAAIMLSGNAQRMLFSHDPQKAADKGDKHHAGPRLCDLDGWLGNL